MVSQINFYIVRYNAYKQRMVYLCGLKTLQTLAFRSMHMHCYSVVWCITSGVGMAVKEALYIVKDSPIYCFILDVYINFNFGDTTRLI